MVIVLISAVSNASRFSTYSSLFRLPSPGVQSIYQLKHFRLMVMSSFIETTPPRFATSFFTMTEILITILLPSLRSGPTHRARLGLGGAGQIPSLTFRASNKSQLLFGRATSSCYFYGICLYNFFLLRICR